MTKKIFKESEENVVVDEGTTAQDSLAANSHPDNNPKSKLASIAATIGALASASSEELASLFTRILDQPSWHAAGLPAGATAEANRASIAAHGESVVQEIKTAIKEDLEKIFGMDSTLSEDFKSKSSTLFEAAIEARINLALVQLEEANEVRFEEEITEAVDALVERIDNYIDYSANKWLEDNEVAVESALRNEIATEFMESIKVAFEENYINIPEEKVDVVDQLAQTVDETETRLNDVISENADLKAELETFKKLAVVDGMSEGLTVVEKEKLKEMASTIDTSDIEDFTRKVEVIKESTFVKASGSKKPSVITEQLEEVDEDNAPEKAKTFSSPQMKSYVDAIKRTARG